jgi:hypothetical protein
MGTNDADVIVIGSGMGDQRTWPPVATCSAFRIIPDPPISPT